MFEEAGSQLLHHLDSGRHSRTYNSVRVKQPLQKVQESAKKPVQEDSWSEEDILTGSSAADIDGSIVDGREPSEMCDTGSHQGDTDEYEDTKLTPVESYMVATDAWENLPNQVCRLCASTDEHPKQSIVGWLSMLNEIIPGLVSYLFLFIYLFALS